MNDWSALGTRRQEVRDPGRAEIGSTGLNHLNWALIARWQEGHVQSLSLEIAFFFGNHEARKLSLREPLELQLDLNHLVLGLGARDSQDCCGGSGGQCDKTFFHIALRGPS